MIAIVGIVLSLGGTIFAPKFYIVFTGLSIQCRHPDLGEIKVIGPVVIAAFRGRLTLKITALLCSGFVKIVFQFTAAGTNHYDVASATKGVHIVHIDIGDCLGNRINRVFGIPLRAE